MSVTLSPLAGAGWQFFDNNGIPLAGGLIYTYAAGTTTPQVTYTTSAGNIANANPIVLDSAGRVSNEVWLTSNLTYKFLLKTATGTQIGSYDNIPAATDAAYISAALAASSGSSLIGFLQAGTGAVATTVQAKLRERVSVLDFGADPTGATSSVAAFQAAIYYCQVNNKTLYLPAGTYLINSPVNTEAAPLYNFSMVGDGDGHVGFTGSGRTVINLTGNATYACAMGYSMQISNFVVTGGVDFIHWNSSGLDGNTTYIDNVNCQSISGAFFKVYTAGNGSQIVMNNCQFTDYLYYGISTTFCVFDNLTNDISTDSLTMTGCWIETYSNATFKFGSLRFQLDNTRLVPYSSAGYWIVNGANSAGPATIILNNADFGGENAGRKLLSASESGVSIAATNCGIFCASKTVMDFYAAPTRIIFTNVDGFTDSQLGIINFDASMTAAEQAKLNDTVIQFTRSSAGSNLDAYIAPLTGLSFSEVARQPNVPINRVCTVADLVATTGSSWITSTVTTGVAGTTLADSIGNATYQNQYEVTSDAGSINISYATFFNINTLPNGNYTYELYLTCTGNVKVSMSACGSGVKNYELAAGCYQLCLPFSVSTNNSRSLAINVTGLLGTKFSASRLRVWQGFHLSRETEVYGSAAPVSASNLWFVGDRVINNVPTVGQPKSWICTVAGTPGTWVSEGNL